MSKKFDEIIALESVYFTNQFGFVFILLGVGIQVLTYLISGGTQLSVSSGICGIFSVVLCSQRKMMFYIFGFAQLFTYVALCVQQRLYGEIAENAFYFLTMLIGIYYWSRNYNDDTHEVNTRSMTMQMKLFTACITYFGVIALYNILNRTNDTQPFMDAITTVPAFVAQILMILRYKDSWYYWLTIDLGSVVMWAVAGDWCMVAQFVFWTVNCIYGLKKW